MRRTLIALSLSLVAGAAYAHGNRSFEDFQENCTSRNYRFNGSRSFVEQQTIEAGRLRSLKVSVTNSPVSVVGGTSAGYTIHVCKAAEVAEDLADIRVTVEGGELRATGPSNSNDWSVSYRIEAPRGADMTLDAKNGPISLREVDGTFNATLRNGPLSISEVSGNLDATVQNGPVSIFGGSGTIKVQASNGPLSIDLDGSSFNGSLDATTKNGPLSVKVPRDYTSGVLVEQLGRGPLSCRADACAKAYRTWADEDDDEPRRIELGSGTTNVRVSTINGPVTIKDK